MSKVYKVKNNKLVVYLPYDVIEALKIKDGDDIDFLKYGESTYLVAKKMDIVKLLSKANLASVEEPKPSAKTYVPNLSTKPAAKTYVPNASSNRNISLEPGELTVLKKLDTLKYNDRTSVKVAGMLNSSEKETLQALLDKGFVVPFKKAGDKDVRYSIQKSVYDMFLYRNKRPAEEPAVTVQPKAKMQQSGKTPPPAVQPRAWEQKLTSSGSDAYIEMLESKGFLVLSNEADAAMVSAALEASIRQGLVLGTRAFNRKFYIGLRGFINKYAARILKAIDQKSLGISDIVKETGVEEDGARTILYVLSESGDVTEVRRDIFRAA